MCSINTRFFARTITMLCILAGAGCASNLKVNKVPLAQRQCGADDQNGFRYYLNRPYLVVKNPVLVSRSVSLVHVDPTKAGAALSGGSEVNVTFLSGRRHGQTMPLESMRIENAGSNETRAMTPEELQKIGGILAVRATANASSSAMQPVRNQTTNVIVESPSLAAQSNPGMSAGVAAADTSAAGGDTSIDISRVDVTAAVNTPALMGDLEVVYLPDLDEQYAIRSCNFMGKTAFGLAFRNGTELAEVQGEHDSTAVALSLLDQVQKAIAAAAGAEQQSIKKNAKTSSQPSPGVAKSDLDFDPRAAATLNQQPIWQVTERTWIKPGIYRLNKPWEISKGLPCTVGSGLLSRLGLPTVVDIDFVPYGAVTK